MSLTTLPAAKKLYSELVSLTQLYLLREHASTERCKIDPLSFSTLKSAAKKNPTSPYDANPPVNTLSLRHVPQPLPQKIDTPAELASTPLIVEKKEEIIVKQPTPVLDTPVVLPATPLPKKTIVAQSDKKAFTLEPLVTQAVEVDLSYKSFFKEHFPHYTLAETIPNDHLAIKIKNNWANKHQILSVVILSFDERKESIEFLKNISKAVSLCLTPACIISGVQFEKEKKWDELLKTPQLRLIITCDYELYLQKNLMQFYHQPDGNTSHLLGEVPLLLLSELSLYLKRPELKRLLWNAICNILK